MPCLFPKMYKVELRRANSAPTSAQLFIDTTAYPMSRVTRCDCSNWQGLFLIIEPRLNTLSLLQIRWKLVS